MDNNGQQWTTIWGATCISDAVFCLCREPETVIAGSPGLLRAARDKLVARERGKGEVRTNIKT